jgi:hypothetical protein
MNDGPGLSALLESIFVVKPIGAKDWQQQSNNFNPNPPSSQATFLCLLTFSLKVFVDIYSVKPSLPNLHSLMEYITP